MIPQLSPQLDCPPSVSAYLNELQHRGFKGEISFDWARRIAGAVDNSVYQLTPAALLYPKHEADVILALHVLAQEQHRDVHLTPRGGGTGTNGQSLNTGIVLDLSRHLNEIVELNLEERWVRVQAGVVLDQLNDLLRPSGLFFAPNLSPSSRATIGGMINTDAAGQGSRVYGKTSDHVQALRYVLIGGDHLDTESISGDEETTSLSHTQLQQLTALAQSCAPLIEHLPSLDRFVTGYNLKMFYDAQRNHIDLTRLLSGSEGTLAVVTQAKLKLTPIPTAKRVLLLRYKKFSDALGSARTLLEHHPTSIETIDHNILNLARSDVIYESVRIALESGNSALDAQVQAINLIEFTGTTEADVEQKVQHLLALLTPSFNKEGSPLGAYLARSATEQAGLWALRKKGVGLLAARPGKRKPVAFVEDTVVPPEHLKDYIKDFTAILDAEGLEYGMFGHVDVGCLHVRPALDLIDPADEARLKRISDQVNQLVQRYGGVIWGEHGKGIRSAYSPEVFGPLYPVLQEIKAVFDPHNQLNPGKVATPAGSEASLMELMSPLRAHHDRKIQPQAREAFSSTVHCNGNAQCLDYHPHHVMCPSSKVTRDRLHSPKGRATVLRAWLKALADQGYVLQDHELSERQTLSTWTEAIGAMLTAPSRKLAQYIRLARSNDDLSHQVYDAMSGCLSCKACATHCPVKVDVPSLKSRFLSLYHERYPRPVRDYLVGALEAFAALGSHAPRLFNFISHHPSTRWVNERLIGLVDAPLLSEKSALKALRQEDAILATPAYLSSMTQTERAKAVILIPDAFNTFFDAETLISSYRALKALGFIPLLAPFSPNGKGLHVKGRLKAFDRCARKHIEMLKPLSDFGISFILIDPAVALTYEDEYRHTLGTLPFEVKLPQQWLKEHLDQLPKDVLKAITQTEKLALFGHCTERTARTNALKDWAEIFAYLGLSLSLEELGCCGMCGVFGHEREHVAESHALYQMSWGPRLSELQSSSTQVLATGYSCRSQVKRLSTTTIQHPFTWLAQVLSKT